VLVEDGVVYAAAGIASYDGTHVYALDALTGKPRWHNHSSGTLHPETGSGVSVNGHLLLSGKQLHLAGGNMVPVASYDLADGKCATDPLAPPSHTQFKAGSDLFLVGGQVLAGSTPLYSAKGDYRMANQGVLSIPAGDLVLTYGPHDSRIALQDAGTGLKQVQPRWQQRPVNRIYGVAVTPAAVVIAGVQDPARPEDKPTALVTALSLKDGATLWTQPLPAAPVPWGVLVDRAGRVVVTMQDGRIVCLAGGK
jgi:outer membrane protein assembly factor BamB